MRVINIPVEDSEFKSIVERKGNMTWREFILSHNTKNVEGKSKNAGDEQKSVTLANV